MTAVSHSELWYGSTCLPKPSILGKLPSPEEYQQYASQIDSAAADIYKYLNFDKMSEYTKEADQVDTKKIQAAQLT